MPEHPALARFQAAEPAPTFTKAAVGSESPALQPYDFSEAMANRATTSGQNTNATGSLPSAKCVALRLRYHQVPDVKSKISRFNSS